MIRVLRDGEEGWGRDIEVDVDVDVDVEVCVCVIVLVFVMPPVGTGSRVVTSTVLMVESVFVPVFDAPVIVLVSVSVPMTVVCVTSVVVGGRPPYATVLAAMCLEAVVVDMLLLSSQPSSGQTPVSQGLVEQQPVKLLWAQT